MTILIALRTRVHRHQGPSQEQNLAQQKYLFQLEKKDYQRRSKQYKKLSRHPRTSLFFANTGDEK